MDVSLFISPFLLWHMSSESEVNEGIQWNGEFELEVRQFNSI
jgi:hypothetical protein